jgi:hypothetical protein
MKYYKNGFFENQIEGSFEISNERWQELLEGQSNGLEIYTKDDGEPDLREPIDTRTYAEKRAAEYPPMADYLDAKVKQASSDEAVVAKGLAQEQNYLISCQAVKEKYPKPKIN